MRKSKLFMVILFALALVLPVFAQDAPTIAEIVVTSTEAEEPEFTVLLAAVQAADPSILEALSDPEAELTVFAPTDAAFTALLEELGVTAEDLLADTELLNSVLQYHVVPGVFPAADVIELVSEGGQFVPTLLEEEEGNADDVYVELAPVMDDMMDEEEDMSDEGEEEAMEEEMAVYVDGAQVITPDVMASNGVVHVIDSVILPDGDPTAADVVVAQATAEEDAQFTVLLAAVQAADPAILEALSDEEGTLTVFAPTDAAFTALLEELGITAEDLLADTDLLNNVLQYHVLGLTAFAETVVTLDGQSVEALNGDMIDIAVTDEGVVLNGAVNVVTTDILVRNGVIHVIDAVLLPPTE